MEVKLWRNTCFSEKNERKWEKHIEDGERLEVSLSLEEIKDTKTERDRKENGWAVFNSIFINSNGPSYTLKGHISFFIIFAKKFIMQITWNAICYHWHASPAMYYGKLLVLFFFKIFPAPTTFSFFFSFAPDDSLRENNKTLTAPIS